MNLEIPTLAGQKSAEEYLLQLIETNLMQPGFSLRWLAQKLGWPNSLITEIRKGNRVIPFNRLVQMGRALELDLSDIEILVWLSLSQSDAVEISKFAQDMIDVKFQTNSGLKKTIPKKGRFLKPIDFATFEFIKKSTPVTTPRILKELPLVQNRKSEFIRDSLERLHERQFITETPSGWVPLHENPVLQEVKSIRDPEVEYATYLEFQNDFLNSKLPLGRMISGFSSLTAEEFMDIAKQISQLVNTVEQIGSRRPTGEKPWREVFQYHFAVTQFSNQDPEKYRD